MDTMLTSDSPTETQEKIDTPKSIHVKLPAELKVTLDRFAKYRSISKTEVIKIALEKMFEDEDIDPRPGAALKKSIEKRFKIPRGFSPRSFYVTLYLLASRYPKASCKKFWDEIIFRGQGETTHLEALEEIKSEIAKLKL